jgi:heme-degrading monooxygenase HmoA
MILFNERRRLAAVVLSTVLLSTSMPMVARQRGPANLGFPDVVAGLKGTPGCLGVQTARLADGKNVVFAWFENKDAVLKWYHSDVHQGAMNTFFPGDRRKPLAFVEGDGPILTIASVTVTDKPAVGGHPISQIAIELYRPLPGGIAVGGRFAPEAMKVPHMQVVQIAKQ